jgi:hypothetical protein
MENAQKSFQPTNFIVALYFIQYVTHSNVLVNMARVQYQLNGCFFTMLSGPYQHRSICYAESLWTFCLLFFKRTKFIDTI